MPAVHGATRFPSLYCIITCTSPVVPGVDYFVVLLRVLSGKYVAVAKVRCEIVPGDAVLPQLAHRHDRVEKSHVVTRFISKF